MYDSNVSKMRGKIWSGSLVGLFGGPLILIYIVQGKFDHGERLMSLFA